MTNSKSNYIVIEKLTTDYQVFTYVKQHLLNQNEKSVDPHTLSCYYRAQSESGKTLMCAIGCLIDDSTYSDKLENLSPGNVEVKESIMNSLPHWDYNVYMLYELQNIHDEWEPDNWSLELERLESYFSENNEYIRAG